MEWLKYMSSGLEPGRSKPYGHYLLGRNSIRAMLIRPKWSVFGAS